MGVDIPGLMAPTRLRGLVGLPSLPLSSLRAEFAPELGPLLAPELSPEFGREFGPELDPEGTLRPCDARQWEGVAVGRCLGEMTVGRCAVRVVGRVGTWLPSPSLFLRRKDRVVRRELGLDLLPALRWRPREEAAEAGHEM